MKTKCLKCNTDLSRNLATSFNEFHIGQLKCPNCQTLQKRYLSEADLLLYFGISSTIYALAFSSFVGLFSVDLSLPVVIGIIFVLMIGIFFALNYLTSFIYDKAPFKKNWKNIKQDEDFQVVKKRMKWQFMMFILVAFFLGTAPDLIGYFIFLILAFIAIVMIKFKLSIKNERKTK